MYWLAHLACILGLPVVCEIKPRQDHLLFLKDGNLSVLLTTGWFQEAASRVSLSNCELSSS